MTRMLYVDFSAMAWCDRGDNGAVCTSAIGIENAQVDEIRRGAMPLNVCEY